MDAQVTSGGGQIEGCASYHNGSAYWFTLPILLADKYGFQISDHYREQLKKMLEYSTHATRPYGANCAWGDSQTYSGTLSMGASCYYMAFKDSTYMKNALYYYSMKELLDPLSQYIWEVPDLEDLAEQMKELEKGGTQPTLSNISWQKDLKQVFLRSDWSKDALYVMFACRTPVQNLHAHMDPAGFEFSAYGRVLLGDPAIYYYKDDENRKNLKSIHWHNCLTIDHKDPWEYISSWSYGPQKNGNVLNVAQTDRLIYAVGEHKNYEPVIHRRAVAIVDQKFLAVMDVLDGVTEDTSVQINFHLDSAVAMADSEKSVAASIDSRSNVTVYSDCRLKPHLVPAKISTKNDVWHDTMIARFEGIHLSAGKHAFLTIAYPTPAGAMAPEVVEIKETILGNEKICFGCTVGGQKYEFCLEDVILSIQ